MFEYDEEIVENLLRENDDFKRLYAKHGQLKRKVEDIYRNSCSSRRTCLLMPG